MFVFIVGRGRSGTTLLKSLLDGHPDISIAPESLFVINSYNKYRHGQWDSKRVESFFKDLWIEGRLKNWKLDQNQLKQRMMADCDNESFSSLCRKVYTQYAIQNGKEHAKYIGDKNPHYSLFLEQLLSVFPGAKFIHIIRDYRDNVLSYSNVRFDLSSTASLAYRWLKYNLEVVDMKKKHPDKFISLRYEDLVADPAKCLEKLCGFVGVKYEDSMLDYSSGESSRYEWHENLNRSVDPGQSDKWRRKMNNDDVAIAETICGELGDSFGYARSLDSGYKLTITEKLQCLYGQLFTMSEKILFYIPINIRAMVLSYYRRLTGSK